MFVLPQISEAIGAALGFVLGFSTCAVLVLLQCIH
jgi:hypothetical protein